MSAHSHIDDLVDNMQGRTVYTVHKAFIFCDKQWEDIPERMTKTTVGTYSSAKKARAALRACMAEELFDEELNGRPIKWADFYVGPTKDRATAIEALLTGVENAEAHFNFPWSEHWANGTVAFNVPMLIECSDDEASEDHQDSEGIGNEDDPPCWIHAATPRWYCGDDDDAEHGHCYEIEAVVVQ